MCFPSFCWGGGGGLNLLPNYQKGGAREDLRGGLLEKRGLTFGGGVAILQKNEMKSEIFDDKKSL